MNRHTHNTHPFNGPLSGTTRVGRYQKGKPIWILLKQETVSGNGISWTICKSAPHSRQTTTPALHRSVFYRLDALPAAQPTVSQHWRQQLYEQTSDRIIQMGMLSIIPPDRYVAPQWIRFSAQFSTPYAFYSSGHNWIIQLWQHLPVQAHASDREHVCLGNHWMQLLEHEAISRSTLHWELAPHLHSSPVQSTRLTMTTTSFTTRITASHSLRCTVHRWTLNVMHCITKTISGTSAIASILHLAWPNTVTSSLHSVLSN